MKIYFPTKNLRGAVALPASKSEANRGLIIQALAEQPIVLQNLSEARDTQTLQALLQQLSATPKGQMAVLDVQDAGTTARFLTAFCAAKGLEARMVGTARMHQRPIGILVDALRTLGAEIAYEAEDVFLPLHIREKKALVGGGIEMRGDVSSQFISAMLLIAPMLPQGLRLTLRGAVGSRPYIDMTLQLMRTFGAAAAFEDEKTIVVQPVPYRAGEYAIEADWSAASYWYSMAALAETADITLLGLRPHSLQGDRQIAEWMQALGVATIFLPEGVRLQKTTATLRAGDSWNLDVAHCPDLAQTLAVVAAAKDIRLEMTGTESLRIKETDRLAALATELDKLRSQQPLVFDTYHDHRMAMAFAPLALIFPEISIQHPEVVAKSYPTFWAHLAEIGAHLER